MSDIELLFAAEATLREPACNYSEWIRNAAMTKEDGRNGINASRARLRAAAIAYAGLSYGLKIHKPRAKRPSEIKK